MDLKLLGKKIQTLRKSKNMTQKDLADFLDYSESYISYIEKGQRQLSIIDLHKIASFFSVDMGHFEPKAKPAHFRAATDENDKTDYTKIMDDFLSHIDKEL